MLIHVVLWPTVNAAPAGPGFYVSGFPGSRSARAECDLGTYCDGSGVAQACPAGRYGSTAGLTNSSCSGLCADGVLCLRQTSSASGQPCPVGQFCLTGIALACPAGTYNPSTGATNASWCVPCPAGTFNAQNGSSSLAECVACPDREGSNPGAIACWPGILGKGSLKSCSVGLTGCTLRDTVGVVRRCTAA
jgi:hypothetical protein